MKYLIYVCTALTLMKPTALHQLLSASRQNNARDGITGMLLYKAGTFMQYIEGADGPIDALYARIQHDPRCFGMNKLLEAASEKRLFPDWSMAFYNVDTLSDKDQSAFSSFLTASTLPELFQVEDPPDPLKLLLSFRDLMRTS